MRNNSKLPLNTDWDEINEFLKATQLHRHIMCNDWQKSDAFSIHPISETSIDCLRCLHDDLISCYAKRFICDENGREDITEERRFASENLFSKYSKIDKAILKRINADYMIADR